ncbi:MAG: class I SAM-dependent methyltransferase [Burkholderiales bacterium]
MGRWSRRLAEPFLDFAGVADGEHILDVGCGTGSLTFAIPSRCRPAAISGLDRTPAFIEYAQSKNSSPMIEFRVGDVCELPYPDASFDRVLSLLCLHFVPDTHTALQELRRVARPGATIAAAVWDARGGFVAQRLFYDTAAMIDAGGNEARAQQFTRPLCRPGELEAAWRAAGFQNVVQSTVMTRMDFASFDDFWTPYLGKQAGAAAYVATLSEERREKLRESVRLAYLDGDPDGPRSYAAIAWAIKGTVGK